MADFEKGQFLTFVGSHRYNAGAKETAIVTVGRKWLTLDNGYRVDKETLWADGEGYTSPGRAYLSMAEYEAETALNAAWDELQANMRKAYRPPTSNLEAVKEATRLLFGAST